MKILSASQIQALDEHTIAHEPIASIDLMERASLVFTEWFVEKFPDTDRPVCIFCGIGNNGGDGLATARLLHQRFYNVTVFLCKISEHTSLDFRINLERLPRHQGVAVIEIHKGDLMPEIEPGAIVVDAVFGSGLNRPVEGYWAELIEHLNQSATRRVAIDIPSGMFADRPTSGACFRADNTLTFELPKLAFLFPENQERAGEWEYRTIGLDQTFIGKTETPFHYIDKTATRALLRRRRKYDHKGIFGHALLIMGSYGKMGAAVLAARACLRSGSGLTTVHIPRCGYEIMQTTVPEAMVSIDRHELFFSEMPPLDHYRAIGLGCGIDQENATIEAVAKLIQTADKPLIIDADGLNILSQHKELFKNIPENSILTPHPKEFERLFGATANDFERNALQREKAQELGVCIVLKGANTCIAASDGACYFNSTGNPGMATGGSGDVLTGIITGLAAQGYASVEAAILGVYLHGLAGDLAAREVGQEALIAGDLVEYLGKAFGKLRG